MAKFSTFDSEPRRSTSTHVSTLPLKHYQYQTAPPGAPPPYRSYTSSQEDDDNLSSNVWSSSETSSANSQKPLGKRRASWSSLVQADDNMHKYKENGFPKVGSPTSNVSSTYSSAINSAIPQKTILSPHSQNGSLLYVNQLNSHKLVNSSPAGTKDASRQNSHTSSGVISDFFVQSKGSSYYKFNESGPPQLQQYPPLAPLPAGRTTSPRSAIGAQAPGTGSRASSSSRPKRDRMDELRKFWRKPGTRLCCLAIILLAIAAVILAYVLTQALLLPKHLKFSWLAPELLRKGEHTPNMIQFDVAGNQARFDLAANMPFKGNYINILDFKTNKVAIVDASLRTAGRNFACFVMDLDRGNIANLEALQKAARGSADKNSQQGGWQEAWNYMASPLSTAIPREQLFQPEIAECRGARWIELTRQNINQKSVKCTDCYDFCVPEYGIEHDYIRDEHFLNIIRRNCFYMFVPEWKNFAQSYSPQQNQQDFEGYFRMLQGQQQQQHPNMQHPNMQHPNMQHPNMQHPNLQQQNLQPQVGGQPSNIPTGGGGGGVGGSIGGFLGNIGGAVANNPTIQKLGEQAESKWISLQTVPQQISNLTSDAYQNLRVNANQFGDQFRQQFVNAANQQQSPSNVANMNNPNPYPQDMGVQFGAGDVFTPNNQNYNPNSAMGGTFQNSNQNPGQQNPQSLSVSSQFSPSTLGSPAQTGGGSALGPMYNTRGILNGNPNMNPSPGFNPSASNSNFPASQSQSGSSAPTLSQLLEQNAHQNEQQQQQFGGQQQQFGGQQQNPFAYNPNQQQPPQQSFGADLSMRPRTFPAAQGTGGSFNPNAQNFGSNQQWPNQNPSNFG
ncbi:BRICHOS domain-containing protein C09F5.1 [Ditylenchus destructor]|uniref:BRICHOS domain-containing protein C09F5.1 n=1 Tax=Ditylenchus destructor TaxID=166010 RepID=A0AAD4R699_9BILA|nr:BRICHOS domain-containing protein C09F5.1 [Ditylenchus destructor]